MRLRRKYLWVSIAFVIGVAWAYLVVQFELLPRFNVINHFQR